MTHLKNRLLSYYEENELKVDIAFFLGGFFFDILTLSAVDDWLGVAQQIAYLAILGAIIFFDFLDKHQAWQVSPRLEKFWNYRQLVVHFLLGSLLSVYSLFFLKSASLFSSVVFVALLMALMVANELKSVQKSEFNIKLGLYIVCVFCFFSVTVPVLLGFVGLVPFLISLGLTGLGVFGAYQLLQKKIKDPQKLQRGLLFPGGGVLALFFLLYIVGLIPPVPLSIQTMGIYHDIEKLEGRYIVSHETPRWQFWHRGDQNFKAEPQDKIYFFAQIFSPARFSDSVVLHWYYKDPIAGWTTTDKIPMSIAGGRKEGYRGFASKQNYSEGKWRISVETTDGREIGRIYFNVTKLAENSERIFYKEFF
ncbi:DUF2914 domain-containing protein [Bdellovibrio sp. 22V]|uniref:DUF2914 domain-containing protein n=1 Tax=Bdellovibrio TaxID=958 RepID=UPI002542BAAD|nr:DUF2914 domain-containing protein [Bdellovibrio sp. 22V]WII73723.1 DUF2914 domain-containing protein [Bdellovibrio sp. 22V]